jgi:Tfp pilus assembly protein PilV
LSVSTSGPKRREAGFTLAEALAALVVLALAMGQVSELIGQFVRAIRETRGAAQASASVLAQLRRASATTAEGQGQVAIGDEVFLFGDPPETQGRPCFFDATGRRCR